MTASELVAGIQDNVRDDQYIGLFEVALILMAPQEPTKEEWTDTLGKTLIMLAKLEQGSEDFHPDILDNILLLFSAAFTPH